MAKQSPNEMLRDHLFPDYHGCRVTVMGLGSFGGGVGAVRFFVERGAVVTVSDQRTESQLSEAIADLHTAPPHGWHLGRHDPADFTQTDLIVVNPAIRRDHPLLTHAVQAGVPITSEMNLFWQQQRGEILAVTGSNGKSTTTALTHSILKHSGRTSWLGGNIGLSLLPAVEQIQPGDRVVLELSSFQLTDLERLQVSPQIAVITNFSPNHLDWHDTLDHYRWAKQTMLRWQQPTDIAVLNADDPDVRTWPVSGRKLLFGLNDHGTDGAFLRGRGAVWRAQGIEQEFPLGDWLKLPGRHNLANALAATAAALAAGATFDEVRLGLETYEALPHRLQFVGEVLGRKFFNDSLATTPESAIVGLEAFTHPVILLAGGYDKHVDLTDMAACIAQKAKAVALMGQTAPKLQKLIQENIARREPTIQNPPDQSPLACSPTPLNLVVSEPLPDFSASFHWAWEQSDPGDVILLSPGCASYDWFRNFADRGAQFQRLVGLLIRSAE